jgi:uncharacterized protein (TIGR00269 family)
MERRDSKFIENFERRVEKTIKRYRLCDKKDKIFVACSGGKDSTTVMYLLNKFGYHVEGLMIDLLMGEWSKKNLQNMKKFYKETGVKLNVISIRKELGYSICYIKSVIKSKSKFKVTDCIVCGILRRWLLNRKARELGATKLATGHNFDDEAETVLMNIFDGNPKLGVSMGPKVGITKDSKFVQRIKPLYFVKEVDVRKYSELMGFPVLYARCPCSVGVTRRRIAKFLDDLESEIPKIKKNIVNNFSLLIPRLKRSFKGEGMRYCEVCGEPSRGHMCNACKVIKMLKGDREKIKL